MADPLSISLRNFGFFLVPGFSLISFAAATEPLRMANLAAGEDRYRWGSISADGCPVRSSSGVVIQPDHAVEEKGLGSAFDAIFVCGSNPVPARIDAGVLQWLKRMARAGVALGGLCTGSYWLAKAGLLDGYLCTLHWEDAERFLSDFQKTMVSSRIFEIDRDRYTCSGGVAPVDLMLSLMARERTGRALAASVAELMVCDRIRDANDVQRVPLRQNLGTGHPKLLEAVSLMESNLEEPLSMTELARYVRVSGRQLERLFGEHLKVKPSAYYLMLRLKRARRLLLTSEMPIIDVAAACGFPSVSHFTRRYRECFGISPGRERRGDVAIPSSRRDCSSQMVAHPAE
ncbi:MAG: GlxA family transcriptional regulator [Lautropia sp.]|nr:GlxA family transcriptional regulator [Lautropia sp.]